MLSKFFHSVTPLVCLYIFPASIYMLKVNNKNTKAKWDTFKYNNKDTRMTPLSRSGVRIVNFEHISQLVLVVLLLTLNI